MGVLEGDLGTNEENNDNNFCSLCQLSDFPQSPAETRGPKEDRRRTEGGPKKPSKKVA